VRPGSPAVRERFCRAATATHRRRSTRPARRGSVAVGAAGGFSFAPAALRIDVGTTVVWEWTGVGGSHNVIDRGGAFESGLAAAEGHAFEHEFSTPGTYEYVCIPHESSEMTGTIVVE